MQSRKAHPPHIFFRLFPIGSKAQFVHPIHHQGHEGHQEEPTNTQHSPIDCAEQSDNAITNRNISHP